MSFWILFIQSLCSNNFSSIFEGKSLRPLNGLRAMAILWVFNVHYGLIANYKFFDCILDISKLNPIKNGDMGVDIFFVLSGFLIADILIKEKERDHKINTFHFLRSRFLRIWPALLIEFGLSIAFGETLLNGLLMLLFVGNFFAIESHLWSVCVEI